MSGLRFSVGLALLIFGIRLISSANTDDGFVIFMVIYVLGVFALAGGLACLGVRP